MNNASQSTNKLCSDCQQFYGNPASENLCSSCFKKKFRNQNANVAQTQPSQQISEAVSKLLATAETAPQVKVEEKVQAPLIEEPAKLKQEDHSRCWQCKKKVNLLGVKCKCEFTFCNKHRMPEDHVCEYDHASFGKDILKNNNPLVQKSKLEKI